MKQKVIRYPVRNIRGYVGLLNGIFGLTPTELDVLAAFVELHLQIKHADIQTNAFSTDGRKIVAKKLGKEDHTYLGPYIKALKDKDVLTQIPGGYQIDDRLLPQGEAQIIFQIR